MGNLSLNSDFSVLEALQQVHLLKSMGHSRQPSDSSVDKFMSREEAADPGDQENKVRDVGRRPCSILGSQVFGVTLGLSVSHVSGFPVLGFALLSCFLWMLTFPQACSSSCL